MATFHCDSSCNIDDPGWNPVRSRDTTESITMAHSDHPGVPRTNQGGVMIGGQHWTSALMQWSMSGVNFIRKRLEVLKVSQHRWIQPPTTSVFTLWEFPWGSKVFGNQETTIWCWGLAHVTCRPRWRICNLRHLPLPKIINEAPEEPKCC